MAYYFAVETEENSYLAKNIRNSRRFGSEYKTTEPYACTLSEIDGFTTEFEDETSLKEWLLKEDIITEENMSQKLSIFYLRDIERRLVSNKILYSNRKKLLENPMLIIKYFEEKASLNDFNFFRTLGETLPENTITKSLVAKLATLIEEKFKGYESGELDNTNIVSEVAKLLIFNIKTNTNGTVMCADKINSESLHNIIAYINDYELSLEKTKQTVKVKIKKENTSK